MNEREKKARNLFRSAAEGILKVELIENQASDATSDSMCINRKGTAFWIEFKALEEWPVRNSTLPLRKAFRPGQVPFMKAWKSWNGKAFVVLKVEKDWLLLDPKSSTGFDLVDLNKIEIKNENIAYGLAQIIEHLESI